MCVWGGGGGGERGGLGDKGSKRKICRYVEIENYPIIFEPQYHTHIAELPLRAGLICDMWTHQVFTHPQSTYEPHPLNGSSVIRYFKHSDAIEIRN